MKAQEWFELAMRRWERFNPRALRVDLALANDGALEDFDNTNGCLYYQWGACLVDIMEPKQVVELGGAMGVWTICAAYYLPKDSHLYSITLPENGLDFAYLPDPPKNVHLIRGDDCDMKNWEGVDLRKTDLWFIDTGIADVHDATLLKSELALYDPYFKKGTVVLFDDIHKTPDMTKIWEEINWDKYDASDPLHYTGYGVTVYDK